jgi:hypothetical protein
MVSQTDPRWREQALCTQVDPELFYPDQGGSSREAKRICRRCEPSAWNTPSTTTSGSASGVD